MQFITRSILISILLFVAISEARILDRILAYLANPTLDVISYEFDITIPSLEVTQVAAKMKMQVVSSEDTETLELHMERRFLNIERVTVNGELATHRVLNGIAGDPQYGLSGDVLSIEDVAVRANQTNIVEVFYAITLNTSNTGLYLANATTLITRNWPYYGRYWFPANDSPLDSAKVSYILRVPQNLTAIANGKLVSEAIDRSGLKVATWKQEKPTTTYNFVFAVAPFAVHKEDICFNLGGLDNTRVDCAQAQKKIPLEVYYDGNNPQHQQMLTAVRRDAAATVYYSKLFGDYEFEKVGFVFSDYPFNMESTSLIVLRNASAAVHEIAHHWWGNNVHIPHWGDFWVSEGFTTYVTGLYNEYLTGTNNTCLNETSTDPLNNPEATDPNAIFTRVPYCKGASSIKRLRDELQTLSLNHSNSKQAFLNLLSKLYREYKGKALSTNDMVRFVKQNAKVVHASQGIQLEDNALREALHRWSMRWYNIE